MNFSKLKLNENAAGVAITSNNPATRNATASGQMANAGSNMQNQGTVNSKAAQSKQSVGQTTGGQGTNSAIRKKSQTSSDTQVNAATPVQTNIQSSYDVTKSNVELVKLREASKSDWRQEMMEAANPNDDPDHPFVEVMPFNDFRMKEAQNLMKKAAVKDKQAGEMTNVPGMKEEYQIDEAAPVAAAIPKIAGILKKVGPIADVAKNLIPGGGGGEKKGKKKGGGSYPTSKGEPLGPDSQNEMKDTIFDDAMTALFEKSLVKNCDNTASPAENKARRIANKNPKLKGDMSKEALKGMETDAFSDK